MLGRIWRNRNSCALFVGMENGAAAVEVPQKIKKELPYDLAVPLLGLYRKELKEAS